MIEGDCYGRVMDIRLEIDLSVRSLDDNMVCGLGLAGDGILLPSFKCDLKPLDNARWLICTFLSRATRFPLPCSEDKPKPGLLLCGHLLDARFDDIPGGRCFREGESQVLQRFSPPKIDPNWGRVDIILQQTMPNLHRSLPGCLWQGGEYALSVDVKNGWIVKADLLSEVICLIHRAKSVCCDLYKMISVANMSFTTPNSL